MDQLAQLPREYVFLNYLRCHDDIGWGLDYPFLRQFGMEEVPHKQFLNAFFAGEFPGSFSRGERYNDDPTLGDARMCGTTASLCGIETALSRNDDDALRLAADLDLTLHAFVLSQSGIPIIYAGDEVGQLNDYSYHFDPDKADDSRYIHRGKFDWKTAEERDDKTSWRWQLFHGLRRMEEIRKRYDVFSASAEFSTFDPGDTRVLGLRRAFRGQVLLALFNFSGAELTVTNPDFNGAVDLLDEQAMEQDSAALPPYGFKWLLKEI
jgi:amylosucrase